jgi:hypothetical protein
MSALATARSPRLLVKVLCFAFGVIACVIAAVFVLFSWQTDARLRRSVVGNMEASQLRFAGIDARLRREHALQAMALAENPTLKAAVDTYYSERGNAQELGQLQSTIETELTKLQQIMAVPALSVTDVRGIVLASAGPYKRDWPAGVRMSLRVEENGTRSKPWSYATAMLTRPLWCRWYWRAMWSASSFWPRRWMMRMPRAWPGRREQISRFFSTDAPSPVRLQSR